MRVGELASGNSKKDITTSISRHKSRESNGNAADLEDDLLTYPSSRSDYRESATRDPAHPW